MNALAVANSTPITVADEFEAGAATLRSFDRVPPPFDVVPLGGMVAVFDPRWSNIVEGRFYVIESQRPVGGMSWETYDQFNRAHGPGEPRVRIATTRRVIRAVRKERTGDDWWFIQENGFADGPIMDWAAGHNIVGEVVGIYRP